MYSTVSGKPLLGCFTRMFSVSATSNALDYWSSTIQLFFESRKSFSFPNSCRGQVRGPATCNQIHYVSSVILVMVVDKVIVGNCLVPYKRLFCFRAPSTTSRSQWLWLLLPFPRDCRPSSRHALRLEHVAWPRRMPLFAACPPLRPSDVRRSSVQIRREPWRRIRCLSARSETGSRYLRGAISSYDCIALFLRCTILLTVYICLMKEVPVYLHLYNVVMHFNTRVLYKGSE